jgi:hypothetical protein
MVMKRTYAILSIIALLVLVSSFVIASTTSTSPMCNVRGVIQSVEFIEAYEEPCLEEEYGCPTDMPTSHPARYKLKIEVDSVFYIPGSTEYSSCKSIFSKDEEVIFINEDKKSSGDSFESGQYIEGAVSSGFGKYFQSYTINVKIDNGGREINLTPYAIAGIIILSIVIIYFSRKK